MTRNTPISRNHPWKGICWFLRALLDFCYSAFVVVLAACVLLLAYSLTLDETRVPPFIIKKIEKKLASEGISIAMEGVSFQPNGRVTIQKPVLRSNELDSVLISAETASILIEPALLLFGQLSIREIQLSQGKLHSPAILSPSGVPEVLIDNIDGLLYQDRGYWNVAYGKLSLGRATFSLVGEIAFLLGRKSEDETDLLSTVLKVTPQLWNARENLEAAHGLKAHVRLSVEKLGVQRFIADALVDTLLFKPNLTAQNVQFQAEGTFPGPLRLVGLTRRLELPESALANGIELVADWSTFPTKEVWLPEKTTVRARSVERGITIANSIAIKVLPRSETEASVEALFALPEATWSLKADGDFKKKQLALSLSGSLDSASVGIASAFAQRDFRLIVDLVEEPTLKLEASFRGDDMPAELRAEVEMGVAEIMNVGIDHGRATLAMNGPRLAASDVWIRSGQQQGWFDLNYNLDTLERRFLVEGNFDPETLAGWFPSWWMEFWEGFRFPEEGAYCLIDSRGVYKKPDRLKTLGFAAARNLSIRGVPMESLRTKLLLRRSYFDFYNIDLRREDGFARGETQFAFDIDPRDDKEKLVGLWVDAESTLDLSIGAKLLPELETEIESIFAPFEYQIPPRVLVDAFSLRRLDTYDYVLALDLSTSDAFSFHGFPFESLDTYVELENNRAEVVRASAGLGQGLLTANASLKDPAIEVDVSLENARFGDTLVAAAKYFSSSKDSSKQSDYDLNKLAQYGGIANLDFEGEGLVNDPQSFTGKGNFLIKEADLAKFRIFGALSKAMEKTTLPLTTLSFSEALGTFTAAERYIELPDAKIMGEVAQINLNGKYDLEAGDLDFRAKLFPFRRSSFPPLAIIGLVLDPLSRFFEVSLTGTFSEPKWRFFGTGESPSDENETSQTPQPEIPTQPSAERHQSFRAIDTHKTTAINPHRLETYP